MNGAQLSNGMFPCCRLDWALRCFSIFEEFIHVTEGSRKRFPPTDISLFGCVLKQSHLGDVCVLG
jgi:hypothetical protein